MKKIFSVMGAAVALMLVAAGCSQSSNAVEKETITAVDKTNTTETESTITFEKGVLETEEFALAIKTVEVIKSTLEEGSGLFITFDLTNKTEDVEIIPYEVLNYLTANQKNETSRIKLNHYHFLDAFGGDTETYNKMVDLSNANLNALLPGKTIEIVEAYALDNEKYDVTFSGVNPNNNESVGEYIVELEK